MSDNALIALQPAFIIHTRSYRDTSLLVDFFTLHHGRLRAVVKGARASTKQARLNRPTMQPFNPLLVRFGGRGSLKNLYQSEPAGSAITLMGDRLFSALYLNELLMRLLPEDQEDAALFALYQQSLLALSTDESIEFTLRQFEFTLLRAMGYGVNLMTESHSDKPIRCNQPYRFIADQGFECCSTNMMGKNIFTGEELIAIRQQSKSTKALQAAKRLCRQALAFHLGGKPLKSRELFVN